MEKKELIHQMLYDQYQFILDYGESDILYILGGIQVLISEFYRHTTTLARMKEIMRQVENFFGNDYEETLKMKTLLQRRITPCLDSPS